MGWGGVGGGGGGGGGGVFFLKKKRDNPRWKSFDSERDLFQTFRFLFRLLCMYVRTHTRTRDRRVVKKRADVVSVSKREDGWMDRIRLRDWSFFFLINSTAWPCMEARFCPPLLTRPSTSLRVAVATARIPHTVGCFGSYERNVT